MPEDGNAVVATANMLEDEPDLRVGDPVTLRIDGQDTTWTLVGIVAVADPAPLPVHAGRAAGAGDARGRAGRGPDGHRRAAG